MGFSTPFHGNCTAVQLSGFLNFFFNLHMDIQLLNLALLLAYTTIIAALIWARFKHFKVDTAKAKRTSLLYDPVVTLHIGCTAYLLISSSSVTPLGFASAITAYLASAAIFFSCLPISKNFDFANSGKSNEIVTSGPYGVVRHPFYTSYIILWTSNTILFNSLILWITLIYLLVFYFHSASEEEKTILQGRCSREYELYRLNVGMFLPRITRWKS